MKVEIYGSAESHTVRGATVNFNADSAAPVTEFVAEVNPNGFDGRTGVDINKNGTTQSVAFGKTCYGGSANVTTGTLTEKYGGGAYDPQNVPAEVKSEVESKLTLETATPGDIVSFDCELGEYPLNSLSFPLAPIQDLHGYDSPWPAGGGVNKLCPITDGYDFKNWLEYNATTEKYTVKQGSGLVPEPIPIKNPIPAGTVVTVSVYVESGRYTASSSSSPQISIGGYHRVDNVKSWQGQIDLPRDTDLTGRTFTVTATTTAELNFFEIFIYSAPTISSNIVFRAQIELGSTPTIWHPYENICPISGWDAVGIERTGFNVWDEETVGGWISTTGSISSSTDAWVSKNYISVKPSAIYYSVNPNTGTAIRKVEYDANKNLIEGSVGWMVGQYTPSANARYIKIAQYLPQYGHDVSINYPSTDHNYHAYAGNRYTITLGRTVYGGTLDAVNGTLTVTHRFLLLDDKIYYAIIGNNRFNISLSEEDSAKTGESSIDLENAFCSFLQVGRRNICGNSTVSTRVLAFQNVTDWYSGEVSTTALRAYFKSMIDAGTPCEVCYQLATPATYQLTPTEIETLLGQNNVWCDAGEISELKYYDGDITDTDIQTENGVLVTGDKLFYALSSPRTSSFTPTAVNTVQGENTMSANTGNIAVTYTGNWFDITPWIAWQGLTFSRNDIDSPQAGRDMAGYLHRGRVASKEKMNVQTIQLTRAQSSKLQTLLYPETIMVRVTPYPRTNAAQILNMYSNNVKTTYVIHRENGEDLQSLSFPLIEN